MATENDQSKEFEPTQNKLDESRRRGDIARSTDFVSALALLTYLAIFIGFGNILFESIGSNLSFFLRAASQKSPTGASEAAVQTTLMVLPVFLAPAAVVLAFLVASKGLIFSTERLAPKLERISILANIKQKFGLNGWVDFLKNTLKLFVALALVAAFVNISARSLAGTAALEFRRGLNVIFQEFRMFFVYSVATALVIGLADLLWQKHRHRSKLRMTRQEMKQETRESEGDPYLKQRRRQKGFDIATNRMLLDVPQAQVIIVNPQHYAVALSWDGSAAGAPKCVAKGIDEVAFRIRDIAEQANIPIRRDPPTARALYATVEIGEEIHLEHYQAVAAAIRFAETIRKKRVSANEF